MNGAFASFASRRAISVLPTPVGPIIRMFFGVISWRSGSGTCWRRQRLRSAIATARLAASWPTMCLSSSETISAGVMWVIVWREAPRPESAERLYGVLLVGVDAQLAGDRERLAHDRLGVELGVLEQGERRGLRVRSAAADRDQAALGLEDVAVAGEDQRGVAVGHRQHRLEATQHAIGTPVFRELDRRADEVARVLLELRLETLEQRERIGGAAGEAGEHAPVVQAAHLARARLDDDRTESDLPVAAERDLGAAPHRDDRRAVELFHAGRYAADRRHHKTRECRARSAKGSRPFAARPCAAGS